MQKVVAVDIGNSSMKVAVDTTENLVRINADLDTERRSAILADVVQGLKEPAQWLVCSVDSQQTAWLREWVSQNRDDDFQLISTRDVEISSLVEDVEGLGRDRLLAAWYAAIRTSPGVNSIIVDAGTAVTIDVTVSGVGHVGGLIFPGASTCLAAVSAQTDALPDLSKIDPPKLATTLQLGRATESAILLGVHQLQLYGIVAMVRSLEQQYADAEVWCCGGAIESVRSLLPTSWNYDRDFLIDAIFHLHENWE